MAWNKAGKERAKEYHLYREQLARRLSGQSANQVSWIFGTPTLIRMPASDQYREFFR